MTFENRDEDKTVADTGQDVAEDTTAGKDAMRPIPDGGLQQSMPEWLRRPPAWRNLPKRGETPPVDPSSKVDAPAPVAERPLPEPDASEIDPRSLVDVSDLPQWLQDIAARNDAQVPTPEPAPVTNERQAPKEIPMSDPEKRNPVEVGHERSIPFEPVNKGAMDAPEHETKTFGGGPPKQGMSPVMLGIIALAAVVIVALVLIAVL